MALSYIWAAFFLVGFLAAAAQWIVGGDAEIFKRIVDGTFESARFAVMDIALPLAGVMTLWAGVLATAGGLVFGGSEEGHFYALDANTGAPLWRFQTGAGMSAAPMAYLLGGHQHVVMASRRAVFVFALP